MANECWTLDATLAFSPSLSVWSPLLACNLVCLLIRYYRTNYFTFVLYWPITALHYKPQKIQGVDIDPSLIGKAQKFVLKTFSQLSSDAYTQTTSGSPPTATSQETTSTAGPRHQGDDDVPYEEYFPKALQKIHGTLPVPKRTERTEHLFPHNIELQVSDWVTESDEVQDIEQGQGQKEQDKWDVILGYVPYLLFASALYFCSLF